MLRLAYFSPLPPQRTGIADYSADLLPYLDKLADVTLYVDGSAVMSISEESWVVHHVEEFRVHRWQYDMAMYQMGNSMYHDEIYNAAIWHPGILVLHDYTLHHFMASRTAGRGDFAGYLREMTLERGVEGAQLAWQIKQGAPTPLTTVPLTARVIGQSAGVLVHSDYARRLIQQRHPTVRIRKVPQPIPLPQLRDTESLRAELRIPQDAFVVITCGGAIPEKRLGLVAQALDLIRERLPNLIWLKTGSGLTEQPRMPLANHHTQRPPDKVVSQDWVRETGYIEGLSKLNDYLMASNVCINLRHPSAGETSACCLRALAAGVPVVVSNTGWYRELPAECCPRVIHDGTEVAQLAGILTAWSENRKACFKAGQVARSYVAKTHAPQKTAASYVSFTREILSLEVTR